MISATTHHHHPPVNFFEALIVPYASVPEDVGVMKNDDARHIVNKVAEDVAIDFKDNVFNDEDSFRIHKPKI